MCLNMHGLILWLSRALASLDTGSLSLSTAAHMLPAAFPPRPTRSKMALGIARSSLFLSLYCTLAVRL